MQVAQFALEQHVEMVGAGNVARTAGAGAAAVDRGVHRGQHLRMLAHAQIIVGTPDRDFLPGTVPVPGRLREMPRMALDIGEHAIAAFPVQIVDPLAEETVVLHGYSHKDAPAGDNAEGAGQANRARRPRIPQRNSGDRPQPPNGRAGKPAADRPQILSRRRRKRGSR